MTPETEEREESGSRLPLWVHTLAQGVQFAVFAGFGVYLLLLVVRRLGGEWLGGMGWPWLVLVGLLCLVAAMVVLVLVLYLLHLFFMSLLRYIGVIDALEHLSRIANALDRISARLDLMEGRVGKGGDK